SSTQKNSLNSSKPTSKPSQTISPSDKPQIISTKPDPLDETIISAAEIIEITFNRPLENVGELKVKIEPNIEYKVELSGDRKTAKIIPVKPYNLGASYTLSIGPDSKFDGVGSWGKDKTYHFRTIKYTGV
ncbi:MAG: hypothetical protein UT04_C0069G0001, partial [Candidatus Daviesbacteria bacterium GW2011_GWF2_38_7]